MSQEIHPSNPLFLAANENPSLILVQPPLSGPNYHSWSRSMRMALISKNKLCFVDGSLEIPQKEDRTYGAWTRCNNIVLSWILGSVSPSISESVLSLDTAKEVWDDLRGRFSNGDSFRLSDLFEEIQLVKQGNHSVTNYFTRLNILWDEMLALRPLPKCRCDPKCGCGAMDLVKQYSESDYVIRFLKGLNDSFAPVKNQVLLMSPLPSINKVFGMTIKLERQMNYNNQRNEYVVLDVNNRKPGYQASGLLMHFGQRSFNQNQMQRRFVQSQQKRPLCTHCGMTGHGYPPGFKPKSRINPMANCVDSVNNQEGYDNAFGNSGFYAPGFGNQEVCFDEDQQPMMLGQRHDNASTPASAYCAGVQPPSASTWMTSAPSTNIAGGILSNGVAIPSVSGVAPTAPIPISQSSAGAGFTPEQMQKILRLIEPQSAPSTSSHTVNQAGVITAKVDDPHNNTSGKNGWRVELSDNSRGGGGRGGRGLCYGCGEPGHFARECRLRVGSRGRYQSPNPSRRGSPSYVCRSYTPRRRSPNSTLSSGDSSYRDCFQHCLVLPMAITVQQDQRSNQAPSNTNFRNVDISEGNTQSNPC